AGETVVLEKNVFVERVLPASILRKLSDDEMAAYIEPFKNPGEDRRPTLTWPRQIPIDDEPPEVCELARNYGEFMRGSDIPKLFIDAEPGMILKGAVADYARTWKNQSEASVKGLHFIQEDSPDEIATAVRDWLVGLG
ncbi:MAG: haloalkane dehalogenase, partial [Gammaproteobacteria bacterium]